MLWCEDYRPKSVSDCILPERLKIPFQQYVNDKFVPNLLLYGPAGVGKTTIALALCEELGCEKMLINGSDENGVDIVRGKIKGFGSSNSLDGSRKILIIDEADYISPNAQAAFRNVIEEFEKNCSFIFTCNYPKRIIDAIHSRCACIDFTLLSTEKEEMALHFFKRMMAILDAEKVEYDKKVLSEVLKKFFPDFRRTLNELQRYSKFGVIDVGIIAQGLNSDITKVIEIIKEKDFIKLRKWVATNPIDPNEVFRKIYDGVHDYLKPKSVCDAIITIAEYQYKHAFVADPEINLVACLIELMGSCEFK